MWRRTNIAFLLAIMPDASCLVTRKSSRNVAVAADSRQCGRARRLNEGGDRGYLISRNRGPLATHHSCRQQPLTWSGLCSLWDSTRTGAGHKPYLAYGRIFWGQNVINSRQEDFKTKRTQSRELRRSFVIITLYNVDDWTRNSSFGMLTGLRADWSENRGSISRTCRDSSLLHGVHSSYAAHTGYRGCFTKGKAVGAWCSASSTEV
jgi:hypothetical protein